MLDLSQFVLSQGLKQQLGFDSEIKQDSLSQFKRCVAAEDLQTFLKTLDNHMIKGTPVHLVLRMLSKSKDTLWFICRAHALKNKNNIAHRMVGSMVNITKIKSHQQQLEKNNSELQQFAYISSHDLQAPLRHIMSFTGLLSEKMNTSYRSDEEGIKWMQAIESSAGTMKKMLEDLLDFSTISNKDSKKEPIDLNAVLEDLKRMLTVDMKRPKVKKNLDLGKDANLDG